MEKYIWQCGGDFAEMDHKMTAKIFIFLVSSLSLSGMPSPLNMTLSVAKGELATTSGTEINRPK